MSVCGWCYYLEGLGTVSKAQFDQTQDAINEIRRHGLLPIDFVAEEQGRQSQGVEWPTEETPEKHLKQYLESALVCEDSYTPDWWEGETCYIQMIVEKIDLVSLFEGTCKDYHIPIATSSGWASMLMRAHYADHFKYHESRGRTCVLLYCGDHDPAGFQISECLRENLADLKQVRWLNGTAGYDPKNLIIERFGLNADFIDANGLMWIDNLITGNKQKPMDLASPTHPDHGKSYVQEYIERFGVRKCEANAMMRNSATMESGRQLCRTAIERYYGKRSVERFRQKRFAIKKRLDDFRTRTGLAVMIQDAIETIEDSDPQ